MFEKVFEEGMIGNLKVKNRLIVPPMLTEYAAENGELTERYIRYYEEKAKGGWGLIICEDNAVVPNGRGFKNIPGIWSDDLMDKHSELVDRVHSAGAKIAVQLYHAGRQSHSSLIGGKTVAPSAIQDPIMGETPRELTTTEIEELVEKYAQGARRAKEAGYDAVEIHGAHGYLINQFVSPFSNKRTDKYGGNLNNRLRFPIEIIKRIKELTGEGYPVIYRISAEELVDGGLTIEDTKVISMVLEKAGVSAIHASGGVYKSSAILCAPTVAQTGVFSNYAQEIKRVVDIPVITVNKIIYPEVAESMLRQGKADFISMGRASIADPHLPNKTMNGKEDEILHCIGCRQGCWNNLLLNKPVSCLVNPRTGREQEYDIREAETKKKVMVIGGGPVGMEAAIVAAKRGHEVTLYERDEKLGGQWLLAAIPPSKEQLNTLTVSQKGELERAGVTVKLNTEVDEKVIARENPDHVVVAAGSSPIAPDIKGIDGKNVVTAHDLLRGKVHIHGSVVVIGGGLVGSETAEHIAVHNQKAVIVEVNSEIAEGMEGGARHFLLESLEKNNVEVYTETKVLEIKAASVVVEKDGKSFEIPSDQVVLAAGSRSNNHLAEKLKDSYNMDIVGDALRVGDVLEEIRHAYEIAMNI